MSKMIVRRLSHRIFSIPKSIVKRASVENWCVFNDAQRTARNFIGARGVRAVEGVREMKKKDAESIAREFRRKGVTIKDAAREVFAYQKNLMQWRDFCYDARETKFSRAQAGPGLKDRVAVYRDNLRHADKVVVADFYSYMKPVLPENITHGENYNCYVSSTPDWTYWRPWRGGAPKQVYTVEVTIPYQSKRQLPGGQRVIGGLLTIEASRVDVSEGLAWEAKWVRHGRGYMWHEESGYIVELAGPDGLIHAHGQTLKQALSTARLRRTIASKPASKPANRFLSTEALLTKWGGVLLTFADASLAGMCEPGIRAWCARNFPDMNPDVDCVTVRDAIATHDMIQDVMTVCRIAVRQYKKLHPEMKENRA